MLPTVFYARVNLRSCYDEKGQNCMSFGQTWYMLLTILCSILRFVSAQAPACVEDGSELMLHQSLALYM